MASVHSVALPCMLGITHLVVAECRGRYVPVQHCWVCKLEGVWGADSVEKCIP